MDEQVEWHIGSNKQVDGHQATSEWENHSINILKSQGMSDEDIQIMNDLDIISDS